MRARTRIFFRQVRRSLRLHVLLSLGVIVLAASVLVGLGIGAFVYRTEQDAWQSRQREAVRYAARTITDYVAQVDQFLTYVGALDAGYLQQRPDALSDLLLYNPALLEVIRLDSSGRVIASAHQDERAVLGNLFTIPQSEWFVQAARGRVYSSDVQISAANQPYIILSHPAAGGGVTAARLNMNELWSMVQGLHFGQTGRVYILGEDGAVIAHDDPQIVLNYTNLSERPEVRSALAVNDRRVTGEYTNFAGQRVLGSTQIIEDFNWTVFAETERREAFEATRRALLLLLAGVLMFSTGMFMLANTAMTRLIFRPMAELRDGAARFGQGDLGYRIRSRRKDELGQLSTAFDEMAASLQQREDALAQARDAAQSASQFKSRLLANVSHDLRTPLSAILGYADILKEQVYGSLNDRQVNSVQRILANTQRLLDMVNSLLEQSAIEAGRVQWNIGPMRPADLLEEISTSTRVLARQKGLRLEARAHEGLPELVFGDQRRVYQILTNLVGNAIKFTDQGQVSIAMRPDGTFWIIEVSDTGCGIPAESLPRIFDPFHQVDSSTTRKQRGIGLGLSIVQQLATLMGGSVQVKSTVGEGSVFTVRLPVRQIGAE